MSRWVQVALILVMGAGPAAWAEDAHAPQPPSPSDVPPAPTVEPVVEPAAGPAVGSAGPTGRQTPCEWLVALRDAGASMDDLMGAASARHELFTARDLQCLRQEEFHKRVVEAAKGPTLQERVEEAEAAEAQRRSDALVGRYDIELVGVVVAPAKQNGTAWDGFGTVPASVVTPILALATGGVTAAVGAGEIATYFTNAALTGTSAPDIFGYARLLGPDVPTSWSTRRLSVLPPTDPARDAYFATFRNSPAFTGIHLAPGDAVRITLYDADLQEHDAIGTFDIGYTELMKAAVLDSVAQLAATGQTMNQVVIVQFAVRPARDPTPRMRGEVFE